MKDEVESKQLLARRMMMPDHLKSLLIVASIFSFSLFAIGYAQNFFLIQLVADLVHAFGGMGW